jgi:hypothetical protein
MRIWGQVVIGSVALFIAGCGGGAPGEDDIGTQTEDLASRTRIAEVLGFERARDWSTTQGARLVATADSTQGSQALEVQGSGFVEVVSRSIRLVDAPTRIGVDVRVPQQFVGELGQLHAYIDCRSCSVRNELVGTAELATLATGRFETLSLPLSSRLQQRLKEGCKDLIVRFAIDLPRGSENLALDRLQLGHRVDVVDARLCGQAQPDLNSTYELPNGYWSYHSWRSGASTQTELARLQSTPSTTGVLGFGVDDVRRRFVAVVDAEEDLDLAVADLESQSSTLSLVAQRSCRGGSELRAARDIIERADFHPRAKQASLHHYLAVEDSRFIVYIDPQFTDVGAALQDQLGDVVRTKYQLVGQHGRFDDGQPHYGAAAITSNSSCTSGFVVNGPSGRGAVTAGHCASAVGEVFTSGPYFYGEAGRFPADQAAWDMLYIAPAGQTFSARIHSDPCCPVTRPVTQKAPPAVGQLVCISGRNYLAKCSVEIYALRPSMTIDGQTRRNVWAGRRPGVNIGGPGDSGAPLYIPVGSGNAAVVGIHIAGFLSAPFDETYFHSVTDVEQQLGVSVATF